MPAAAQPLPASAEAAAIRATELLGRPVTTPRGERLGEIEGLLVDVRRGGIHYAILAHPQAGEGADLFAYPLNAFRHGGKQLVLDALPENLRIAPGFENRNWPDPTYRSGQRYVRADALLGRKLIDPLGNAVGTVDDLVLGLDTGRTHAVMVDFAEGGVLPIPPHGVLLRTEGDPVLDMDGTRRG